MEDIIIVDWSLFYSEYEIKPAMQVSWYKVTFECFSVFLKEILRIFSPFWKFNISDLFAVGSYSKIKLLWIEEEFCGSLIKLRNKFLDIARVSLTALPLFKDAYKKTVRVVKLATLKI